MSVHEPNEHNEYTGQETINCEYKEFTFNLAGILLDNKLAEMYCQTNKFDFNKNVIFNLKKYFKAYVPKYASGYFNSCMDGEFYIGINDLGFVKGIPFKGHMPIEYLKKNIIKILRTHIKNPEISNINLDELVQIKISKIKHNITLDIEQHPVFTNYMDDKEKYMEKYNDFVEKTNKWRLRINFAINKLVDLANNSETRKQIIDYIKEKDPSNPSIDLFNNPDFKLEYKNHTNLILIKDNPDEPYYWVTRWKDFIIDKIKSERPVLSSTFNLHNTPTNLIVSVSEMIPYWIKYNSNINLYVIQIKFFGSKFASNGLHAKELVHSNYKFSYYDFNIRKWLRCYRTVIANGEPVCLHF